MSKPGVQELTERLQAAFPGDLVQVRDDSHLHAGHVGAAGGGGHFQVIIRSARFAGLSPIRRHRLVYDAVHDWMPERIHALSIDARLLQPRRNPMMPTPLARASRAVKSACLPTRATSARWLAVAVFGAGISVGGLALAQNAAVINGKPIPSSRLESFVKAMVAQGRPDTPELRQAVREELIARELFVIEAEKRKLGADADVDAQLVRARQDILIGALIRDVLAASPVTDEEVAKEYEKLAKEQTGAKEYKARHILVETEDQAKDIIAKLGKGEAFADLAKDSKDPGSAARGGDLDWNSPETFVPPFSQAMVALKKGKFTMEPVKTQFGFHVIQLDDTREAQPPSLESVQPQLRKQLERQRVIDLQKSLRDKAKVE
ncbi:MAG: BolA/IbaG family iron-sulfur metabolism protein [Burkholderiaceae bacterium]